jgi:uncharacterized protein (DUF2147 family)
MRTLLATLVLLSAGVASADPGVVGRWKTVDDKTHKTESIMKVWEKDGKLFGAIEQLVGWPDNQLCDRCSGEKKNQPMRGLVVFWGLMPEKDGKVWDKGQIMDPKDGKVYRCRIELDGSGALKVRGYVGTPTFGRTQRWFRAD